MYEKEQKEKIYQMVIVGDTANGLNFFSTFLFSKMSSIIKHYFEMQNII